MDEIKPDCDALMYERSGLMRLGNTATMHFPLEM